MWNYIIGIGILVLAVYFVAKNIYKSSEGQCNCNECMKDCSKRKQ